MAQGPSSVFSYCPDYSVPVQVEDSSPLPCLLVFWERGNGGQAGPLWAWPGSTTQHFPLPPKSRKLSHMTASLQRRLGNGGSGKELRLWGFYSWRGEEDGYCGTVCCLTRKYMGGQFAVLKGNKLRQINLRFSFRQGNTLWGSLPVAIARACVEWAHSGAASVISWLWQVQLLVRWITEALCCRIKSSILFMNISILYLLLSTETCTHVFSVHLYFDSFILEGISGGLYVL